MAYIRQTHTKRCPRTAKCGCHWAATVRFGKGPNDRLTETDPSKTVITRWAEDLEADIRRGDFIDPRRAEITVGEWWDLTRDTKHKEKASRARDESHWRVHVEPRWARTRIGSILKPHVSAWVVEMESAHKPTCRYPATCGGCKVGAATVEGALGVLRGLLDMAVDDGRLRANPARKVDTRPRNAHVDRIVDADEEELILARATELFGDRVDARLFIETARDTGLRWEELAALPPEMVDTKRRRLTVAWVMERDGTARPYAKTPDGNRVVGYGDQLAARLLAAKLAAPTVPGVYPERGPERLVFYAPGGGGGRKAGEPGPLRYTNWRKNVWVKVLLHEVADPKVKPAPASAPGPARRRTKLVPYLDDPQPTFHDLRHSTFTEQANNNVPIHDIMANAGHSDIRSSQRYLHSTEERFDRAREARKAAQEGRARRRGEAGAAGS